MPSHRLTTIQATALTAITSSCERRERLADQLFAKAQELEARANELLEENDSARGEVLGALAQELGLDELPEGWSVTHHEDHLEIVIPDPAPERDQEPPEADGEEADKAA